MTTFVYKGERKKLRLHVGDTTVNLSKGQPFTTEDKRVARELSLLKDVEEVAEKKEEPIKPSRKTDAVKS